MEIKNKWTVIRGERGGGLMGERRGRGKQKKMNRGLMDRYNGGWGTDCGSEGSSVRVSNGETGETTVTQ